jgi:hypothetical protein
MLITTILLFVIDLIPFSFVGSAAEQVREH